MKTICLATNNQHKVEELQKMLEGHFEIKTLQDIGCTEDIAETADTFEGNSLIKADYVYQNYHIDCIADDSGLVVDALNGEPGVYSARYAGEHGNHDKNMDKLLLNLKDVENRTARFKTVVTMILAGETFTFEGAVEGKIIDRKTGDGGFGYDPIFMPDGYDRTFAQMSMEEKNPISHRGRAIEKLIGFLKGR
ncbi:non-canonical purine NTP diphosphatase [Jiulongibacter sp. NS-SX5]|uniref:non-canonical purine NTP diphosphatase n=1 Tax=Jiulongibacter sp. NS-SX5 TaxID=3463854 RepID=UPI00405A4169